VPLCALPENGHFFSLSMLTLTSTVMGVQPGCQSGDSLHGPLTQINSLTDSKLQVRTTFCNALLILLQHVCGLKS
jgi:hypothetical protein